MIVVLSNNNSNIYYVNFIPFSDAEGVDIEGSATKEISYTFRQGSAMKEISYTGAMLSL